MIPDQPISKAKHLLADEARAYAYPYGRVSGMHQKLLSSRDFETFARARSVSEIIASLDGTEYETELRDVGTAARASDVESALMRHFMRTYSEIASLIPKKDRILLGTLILGEFDVRNLKTILRGIHVSLPGDEIQKLLLPVGNIKFEKLIELSKSKDMADFASRIGEPYECVLRDASFPEGQGNLASIEMSLDNLLITQWSNLASKDLRDYVDLRIDIMNITNIIRCKVAGIPPEKYILLGGTFSEGQLGEMSSENISGVLAILDNTAYGKIVREAMSYYEDTGSLLRLEQRLNAFVSGRIKDWSLARPLGICSIIGFIDLKLKEIKNLRTIITTKERDFDPERIKSLLIR